MVAPSAQVVRWLCRLAVVPEAVDLFRCRPGLHRLVRLVRCSSPLEMSNRHLPPVAACRSGQAFLSRGTVVASMCLVVRRQLEPAVLCLFRQELEAAPVT